MYRAVIKRFFDFLFAIIGFSLLLPIFMVVFILLIFQNKGTPFFYQQRPGKNEKIFKIVKFKTMNNKTDASGNLLPDSERITKLGHFIRKSSLDEIPQLLNVVMGDMSIVGPRPLLPEYLPLYSAEQNLRHTIRPGITGWAQINGRNAISWTKKLALDKWYVENQSFLLDVKIILLTVKKVLKKDDISSATHATIEKFNGQN